MGRERGTLLPQALVAQMLAREDDRPFGLQELVILGPSARDAAGSATPARAGALRIRGEAPGDRDSAAKQLRPARMEGLDRFAADAQPFGMA